MQMSVDSIMNGEHPYYRINNFDVYLDRKKVSGVFNLDTLGDLHHKTGHVDRYVTDENGYAVMNGEELETERVYGSVEIKLV